MSCDPQSLMQDARCVVSCIPASEQSKIQTSLLAAINSGSTNPQTLVAQASDFINKIPPRSRLSVQVYLLWKIFGQGSGTPGALAQAARCYQCIPPGWQKAMQTYLMCVWSEGGAGGCSNPIVVDWLARMAANGVTLPTTETIRAVCDFCNDLDLYSLTDKMLVVNPVIPDSLSSMRYPLIYQVGNGFSPFLNNGFVAADLDNDGILGDGLGKYFDTGFIPDQSSITVGSAGLSVYTTTPRVGGASEYEIGGFSNGLQDGLEIAPQATVGQAVTTCWQVHAYGLAEAQAFYSGNRTAGNRLETWEANSAIPIHSVSLILADESAESISDVTTYFMATLDATPSFFTSKRVSFMAIHLGLNQSEVSDFFNAVQQLRIGLGGGWI